MLIPCTIGLVPLQAHTIEVAGPRGGQRRTVMRFSVPAELAEEGEHAQVIAEALARHKQELTERATRACLIVHHVQERVYLDRVVL